MTKITDNLPQESEDDVLIMDSSDDDFAPPKRKVSWRFIVQSPLTEVNIRSQIQHDAI